jgi:hypothetical protein
MKPGEACASDQCVANAMCNTTCTCNTGNKATPTSAPTSCESEYTYMKELDEIKSLKLTQKKRKRSFVAKCLETNRVGKRHVVCGVLTLKYHTINFVFP